MINLDDLSFKEFKDWACGYILFGIGAGTSLQTLMYTVIDQTARNKIWGGQRDQKPEPKPEFKLQSLDEIEKQHILFTLDCLNWNKSKASETLGIERSTLDRKLKSYGVERPDKG